MGYRGVSEEEAIRRRGKFAKPKRGGFRGIGGRECDEDEIKRRNELGSGSESDEESSSGRESDSTENSDESSSNSSEDSSSDNLDDGCSSEDDSKNISNDPTVSKSQIRKDLAQLALIKKRREEAARNRLSQQ